MADVYPVCPHCKAQGNMYQIDLVPGLASIVTIDNQTGAVVDWAGDTEMQWDDQRPANRPPKFFCKFCYKVCTRKQMLRATQKANKKGG